MVSIYDPCVSINQNSNGVWKFIYKFAYFFWFSDMKKLIFFFLLIVPLLLAANYNRTKDFGHWIDADHDGENTRTEVLKLYSVIPATVKNGHVIKGLWHTDYSQQYITDPSKLDIDHFVPLKEAYSSGADKWTEEKRIRFANDYKNPPNELVVVTAHYNRSKGAKDPSDWLPPYYPKEYMKHWILIKEKWNLCYDKKELNFLNKNGFHVTDLCK